MSALEGSWGRSIRIVSHPAPKFRHGCRLSGCDGHGLRISTVNPADEPRWEEELAHPSFKFAFVLLQACVFHPPRFRLTSTEADGFCILLAALRHYRCESLSLALTTFAAVRWCGANGAIVTRRTGRWGSAAPVLLSIGSYSTGTMGCTMGVQFLLVKIKKAER